MVQRNKRQKGLAGTALLIGSLLSAAIGAGTSIYNTRKQTEAMQQAQDEQDAAMRKNANAENNSILRSNLEQLANSEQKEIRNFIPTQNSAFKLGGRRCKRKGGTVDNLGKFI